MECDRTRYTHPIRTIYIPVSVSVTTILMLTLKILGPRTPSPRSVMMVTRAYDVIHTYEHGNIITCCSFLSAIEPVRCSSRSTVFHFSNLVYVNHLQRAGYLHRNDIRVNTLERKFWNTLCTHAYKL